MTLSELIRETLIDVADRTIVDSHFEIRRSFQVPRRLVNHLSKKADEQAMSLSEYIHKILYKGAGLQ
jgi:hypothetical protein